MGHFYSETMRLVKDVLGNIEKHFPDYEGQGYEDWSDSVGTRDGNDRVTKHLPTNMRRT